MDTGTGEILWERNSGKKWPPASTTKIMTAIIVLENGHLDEKTIITPRAEAASSESSIWLQAGEELSVNDLLSALMIKSANDAAVALAEYLGGSESNFVDMMNKRAAELGARDTHFVNPHGLWHPDHLTTARDLALIARYALRFKRFNELVKTKKMAIDWSGKQWDRTLVNRNHLLWDYPGADGIKTGFIRQSGRCLVSSATRNDWRLMGVILGSSDAIRDSSRLLDYGFKNFKPYFVARKDRCFTQVAVRGGIIPKVALAADRNLYSIAPAGTVRKPRTEIKLFKVKAPVRKGKKCGYVVLYDGDKPAGKAELLALAPVGKSWIFKLWDILRIILGLALITIAGVRFNVGRTFAKNTRQIRYRLPQGERNHDLGWSRYRKRPDSRSRR